jgi:2-phosphosulfolactate phosphatase
MSDVCGRGVLGADLAPAGVDIEAGERPTAVHLTPGAVSAEALAGDVVIVIDALRASVTMCRAIEAGATCVWPVLTVEEARARAAALRAAGGGGGGAAGRVVVLGGERGGLRPEGFDLGNSPAEYTPQQVGGREVVFSTSNGTATLLHARRAARVLVGCMGNVAGVVEAVADEPRTVHIICAGTREAVSMEDVLVAGVIARRLVEERGRSMVAEDSIRMAMRLATLAEMGGPEGVREVFWSSRGGRNLRRIGLEGDIEQCARVGGIAVVPRFDGATGAVVAAV